MPTIFREGKTRVVVYPNDHQPGHVHAVGPNRKGRFRLNCPEGPVELWDHTGDWTMAELNALGVAIAERIAECCKVWREIHG